MDSAPVFHPSINDDRIPSVLYVSNEKGNRTTLQEPASSQQEEKKPNYLRNRILILAGLFVVTLLSSWLATKSSFTLLPRILGPSWSVGSVALENIYKEPAKTGDAWAQCIRSESQRCSNETILAHFQESYLIKKTQDNNRAAVEQAFNSSTQCSLRVSDAHTELRERLVQDGLPWKTCPKHDREVILRAAGDDVRKGQNAVMEIYDRQQEDVKALFQKYGDWAGESFVYHRNYIFGELKKVQAQILFDIQSISIGNIQLPGLEGLITCLVPDDILEYQEIPCPFRPLSLSLRDVQRTAEVYIKVANEQIQMAAMVIATLVERYDWAVGSIQDLVRIIMSIRNVLGRPFDLAWKKLGGLDLSIFGNIKAGGLYVPGDLDFPHIPDLKQMQPYLDEFRVNVRQVAEAADDVLDQVTDEVKHQVATVVKKVTDSFDRFFRNYNPPSPPHFRNVTDFGAPVRAFEEVATKSRAQLLNAVKNIKVTGGTAVDADTYSNYTTDNIEFDTEEFKQTKSFFQSLTLPRIPDWVWTFVDIFAKYSGVIDLVGRIWWHISRFRKFFHTSSVPVPVVVVGTPGADREEEEEQEEKESRPCLKKAADIVFNTRMKLLLVICFVLLSLGFLGFGLKRSIAHYQSACVERPSPVATDLVNTVVWPTVHNTVTAPGEAALRKANAGLYYQRHEACSVLQATSHVIQHQLQERLFSSDFDYNKTVEESNLILDCIDVSSLGSDGPQLQQDLHTCSQPRHITLDDGLAYCDWPECEMQCNDEEVTASIKQDVIENMCIYEWYFYSEAIILFLMVLQYWCMWFASILFEQAVFALLRKRLRRNSVKWVYEQDVESGEIVGAEGMSAEEAKAQALQKFERREKFVAFAKLFGAASLIALFVTLRVYFARVGDFLEPKWFDPEKYL